MQRLLLPAATLSLWAGCEEARDELSRCRAGGWPTTWTCLLPEKSTSLRRPSGSWAACCRRRRWPQTPTRRWRGAWRPRQPSWAPACCPPLTRPRVRRAPLLRGVQRGVEGALGGCLQRLVAASAAGVQTEGSPEGRQSLWPLSLPAKAGHTGPSRGVSAPGPPAPCRRAVLRCEPAHGSGVHAGVGPDQQLVGDLVCLPRVHLPGAVGSSLARPAPAVAPGSCASEASPRLLCLGLPAGCPAR